MADVPALMAQLRQRRLDLGLTQREVGERSGIGQSLVNAYETGRTHSPMLSKVMAIADALGCDLELVPRPAPPLKTRFDSLAEMEQDMRDNAWARRVASPGVPDDIEEIKRRLAENETAKKDGDRG